MEALVALGIMAGGVAAVAQVIAIGAGVNRAARQTTRAVVLAQEKMEELVLLPDAGGGADLVDGVFTRRWTIDPLPGASDGAVVIQVFVADSRNPGRAATHLVGARTRQVF